jgi:ribosomal protein S27E
LKENGKELAKLALENRRMVDVMEKELDELRSSTDNEVRRLQYDVYEPKLRAIQDECSKAIEKVKADALAKHNAKVLDVRTIMEPVRKVERILEFFRLDTRKPIDIADEDVKQNDRYKERYRENLGLVFDDPFLKVRLFVMENDKPKNKYILVLIGRCLFDNGLGDRPLLKLPRDYGLSISEPWGSAPQHILKEAATVKELHSYWTAHGFSKVPWVADYVAVRAEYEHILKTYRVTDFEDFLTWKCPKCGYFHTVFENYSSRNGEVMTCYRCPDKTPLLEVKHDKPNTSGT